MMGWVDTSTLFIRVRVCLFCVLCACCVHHKLPTLTPAHHPHTPKQNRTFLFYKSIKTSNKQQEDTRQSTVKVIRARFSKKTVRVAAQ